MRAVLSSLAALFFLSSDLAFAELTKVGVIAPLSGIAAEYGAAVRNGFELAKKEQATLKSYTFIYEDDQYDAAQSITAYRKLRSQDQVSLIYTWGEPGFHSIAPIAEADKFLVFTMSTDREPGIGKNYVVRAAGDSYQLAGKLVEYFRSKGGKEIDVITAEDPFFESYLTALNSLLRPEEKLTVVANFNPTNQDFRSAILKLKNRKPKFLAVFLQAGQARSFFKQAQTVGFHAEYLGTDVFESTEEIKESGPDIEGSIFANFYVPPDFRDKYRLTYNNDTQLPYAYLAYSFAKSLPQILPPAQSASSDIVLERLRLLRPEDTQGAFRYVANPQEGNHLEFKATLRRVVKGGVEDLELSSK